VRTSRRERLSTTRGGLRAAPSTPKGTRCLRLTMPTRRSRRRSTPSLTQSPHGWKQTSSLPRDRAGLAGAALAGSTREDGGQRVPLGERASLRVEAAPDAVVGSL